MRFFAKLLLTGGLIILTHLSVFATHLRAGEITATRINCSLEFKICITVYVNTGSSIDFGSDGTLSFGDGKIHKPPVIKETPVPGSDNIGVVTYCYNYTYPAAGIYTIRYFELNRNEGILNINESVNVNFFLETHIEIDPFIGCDNSPKLLTPPIDKACTGARWQHNPGAYDTDGDSLSFRLIAPQHVSDVRTYVVDTVPGYRRPNVQAFYSSPLDYNNAQQDGTGRPIFFMDSKTGTITWDAPGNAGEYNIAFMIIEWRKVNNKWLQIGYIIRDMQILVENNCQNLPPVVEIDGPPDLCVIAGDVISETFYGSDSQNNLVTMEMISEIFKLDVSPATYSPSATTQQPTSPQRAESVLTWQTNCSHIKQQPYLVVVKITDEHGLAAFMTVKITVVGPSPEWNSISLGANRSAQLNWKPYDCASKADSMQIWRRIDSIAYTPECKVTGMPMSLGYTKIKTVHIGQTSYLDTNKGKGLPPGATVCYRLVASFPAQFGNIEGGSESLVSDQACFNFDVDAPVITNVTIDSTSREKGEITVRWTPPFEATGFSLPYYYNVYRAVGFSGKVDLTLVKTIKWSTGKVDSTFLVDSLLNTTDNVYNYRILAFDANNTLVDTSAIASSVRLQAKSLLEKIELTWTADVPWSLMTPISPKHFIYRGDENQTEGEFELIDSVYSTDGFLRYTDAGTYKGEILIENQTYCYRVETYGGYGYDDTSKIPEPLINFSQVVCARPSDLKPPCQPELVLDVLDCDEYYSIYGCSFNDYNNVLRWPRPTDQTCRDDISHYRIYYSPKANADTADYVLLVDLEDRPLDTTYVDRNLPSFARCYRIKAVDRSGNESAFSNEACNDNCPNYHLPNVFTPGNGDDCNDLFSAFSDGNIENGRLKCGGELASDEELAEIRSLCPRFVLKVEMVVVDRWGKQVYTYASGSSENSIFIDWDGRDDHGRELNSGIYFYSAKVTFEALYPKDREKVIKGWVQLVRPN